MAYPILNNTIEVDGLSLFYRTSGPADGPVLLLLHGYPTSSYQFLRLIPLLSDKYKLIAPDFPGYGFTDVPAARAYKYTFDDIAVTVRKLLDKLSVDKFAIYVFDYGAAVGWRLALERPEAITAIITQDGNAYEEGLSSAWDPIRAYWADRSRSNAQVVYDAMISPEGIKAPYLHGVPASHLPLVDPVSWTVDTALTRGKEQEAIQLALFYDYQTNLPLYPVVQAYFRKYQPPILSVWGKNDPFFLPAGAEAYSRDIKDAKLKFYNTGHFALETHVQEIAEDIKEFLGGLKLQ